MWHLTLLSLLKVRLQEVEEKERGGRVPRTVDIELFEDLCDSCVPGDVVTVTGVVKVSRMQRSGSSITSESGYWVLMTKNLREKNTAEILFYLFMIKNYTLLMSKL